MKVLSVSLLLLVLLPLAASAASYDVETLGVPRFVNTNYIDAAKIFALSRFRSSAGHDYSDGFETCRSMKHYFMYPDATTVITAPVSGTITRIFDEWAGTQVQITSALQPAFTFIIFHIALARPLLVGDSVQEAQILGNHIGTQTYSDIAVQVNTPAGLRLISYFETLTDTAFAPFMARGISNPAQLIISRQERDAAPYHCSGEQFTNLPGQPDIEYVTLNGSVPPTAASTVSGPISNQTILLAVTPPTNVQGLVGSLFIAALFPASRGGAIYFLTPTGAWVLFSGCSTAPAYSQSKLYANMGATVIGTPANLTPYQGVVLYAGYGIGTTWQTACNNMLLNKSYSPGYSVQ